MMFRPAFFALPAGIFFASCATRTSSSLPDVQRDIAARSTLSVAWPTSAAENSRVDQMVASLLSRDLTPDSAAAIAVLNNRELRATFEELGLSQAELLTATRMSNPTFSASVRWPDSRPRSPNVEFNLGLDVLNAVLLPLRKKFAGEQLRATEQHVGNQILSLAADAKEAVYTLLAHQALRARLASILEVNEAGADLAQQQFNAGNINRLDLLNQQAEAQQTQLELARADAQVREDREKINRLLSLSGTQIEWKAAASLPTPSREPELDNLENFALAERLDLQAAKSRVDVARAALVLKQKTRLLPGSVKIGVDTEREPDGSTGPSRVTGPNLELALPIFDQGQADLARLSAESRRADAVYESLAINISSQVREARNAMLAARRDAEYYDTVLLPQRRAILQETLLHYNAMQKSAYELLLAKQHALEAERGRIDAWREYWVARIELERAVGADLERLAPATNATNGAHP